MNRRRVSKNALALLLAQVAARGLNVLLGGQLARTVGAAGLGRYLAMLALEGVALAAVSLGLNLVIVRESAREGAAPQLAEMLGTALALKVGGALVGMALLNGVIAPLLYPGARRALVALVSLALLPEALNGLAIAFIKGRQRMALSSAVDLGARALAALGGVALLRWGYDERAVLAAYAGGQLLATVAFAAVLIRWKVYPRFHTVRAHARQLLRQSLPFAVSDLVAILYRRMALLLLPLWHGDAVAGLFGAAYSLWATLGLIPASFLDALFPALARLGATEAAQPRLQRLYRRGRRVLLGIVAAIGLPSLLLARPALALLYGDLDALPLTVSLFRALVLILPCTYLYLLDGHALYAVGAQRRVTRWMVAVTALHLVLNLLLIPRWSSWGAFVAVASAELALCVALRWAARQVGYGSVLRGDVYAA